MPRLPTLLALLAMTLTTLASTEPDPVSIGAIRWDAWFADAVNPYEKNLADRKWRGRLPFYAKVISDSEVQVRGDTQEAMDQEIAFAKAGGLGYWAFLYYAPAIRADGFSHDFMNRARNLYLSSAHKADINFCLLVDPLGSEADIVAWIAMMQEPSYQKVAGGRPLLYLMYWGDTVTTPRVFGSVEKGRAYMDAFRRRIMDSGQKNPYIVALAMSPQAGATAVDEVGLDAISAYTSWGGTDYAGLSAAQAYHWELMKATGKHVVPNVSCGWGGPRDGKDDTQQPTPGELATHVRKAYDWITANREAAEARTMLIYAWNEIDEGGWLVPDKGQGTAKLDAIRSVVEAQTPKR